MALTPYEQLEQEFRRLHAFRGALSLLRWDAAVMMPRGSADVRGEQLAALETEHHALLTTPKVARLLERAEAAASQLEDWPLANLREMRRQRDHAIATPPSLIARLAKATARAEVFWVEARKANDFKILAPHLEEVVQLVRDRAALLGQARGLAPYDALVDAFTPGISTADIDTIFKALSRKLPGLINGAIEVQSARPPLPLPGKFTVARQRQLCVEVLKALGFPFDRGRLDESEHPFTEGVPGDIRVTTRFDAGDPFSGLLGAVHETGHAMYDLGLPAEVARSARRPRPGPRARGEPVAALRDEPVPQPLLRDVSAAAAGEVPAGERRGMERGELVPASDPREAQPDSHGRRRAHLSGAHHAALRAREEDPRRRAAGRGFAGGVERQHRAAPQHPARQRRRRLPAGHSLGGGALRLFPLLRPGRGHRRPVERGAARRAARRSMPRSRPANSAA